MYQNWWWYRTSNMQYEVPLSNPVVGPPIQVAPNQAVLRYSEGGAFFELVYTLTGVSPTLAKVDIDWQIVSLGAPLDIDFFAYSDFDLNGTAGNDSGMLVAPNTVRYIDGTTAVDVVASASGLVGYDADDYSDLLDLLDDTLVYNVSNTGLPYSSGDLTNVFQWHGTLVSGQQALSGKLTKIVNLNYNPPPSPVIPEPGTWALMLSGLAPVALRLRRNA